MTRSSSSSKPIGSPFCAICDKKDDESNLLAAGTQGAAKDAVDIQLNAKLNERWDGGIDKTDWNCQRIIEGKDQHYIEEDWIKATCFESIVMFIIEEDDSHKGLFFVVRQLNEMYIHMFWEHSISETVNTTRFVAELIESLPNLYSSCRKDIKTIVMFHQQVDNLLRDYVETPDALCASLQKVVNLIWKAIFEKKNNFDGHFKPLCRCEPVLKSLLHLISSLIDGTDSNEYNQEVVIVVQLVTSHASRSHWKYVPDFLFEVPDKLVPLIHSKNQETPIMFYNFLKIYMTNWSRNLLDHFLHLGIWFFYDRVLEITKNI